jgi:hypothetical protein
MGFTLVAVVAGVVIGLLAGGRVANASARPLRGTAVLGAAVVLQALPQLVHVSGPTGLGCVLGSYVLLLAFAAANIRLVGMPVVLVGLVLNLIVIAANSGMPVRADAILTIERNRTPAELENITFGAKRHLEVPGDRLTILGDVLPVRVLHQVLSFGDLVLAVGIGDLIFRLLKPGAPIGRRRRAASAELLTVLPGGDVPSTATELSQIG